MKKNNIDEFSLNDIKFDKNINELEKDNLLLFLKEAIKVSKNAYSPYSNFYVGACLIDNLNNIYTGCNVENHGIMSICAERSAFCKAISNISSNNSSDTFKSLFKAIFIVGRNKEGTFIKTLPCGYCRQFMSEFVDINKFKIYTYDEKDNIISSYILNELLPNSFNI